MTAREQILLMHSGFWIVGCWGTYVVVVVVRRMRKR